MAAASETSARLVRSHLQTAIRSVSRTYFKTWSYFTYQRGARLITGRRLTLLPRRPIAEDGSVQKVQEVAGEYQVR